MSYMDTSEDILVRDTRSLLNILLKDQTTKKNIVWATHSYEWFGKGFWESDRITSKKITGPYAKLIQPRVDKSTYDQKDRTKIRAEVFTPTWIVDKQVSVALEEYQALPLADFLTIRCLEITCGEAPYMVSRYDAVTGETLALNARVGFLDKKLQRIGLENMDEATYFDFVVKAYQSSYGYEYQGDSLLLARENLLATFDDYYWEYFKKCPSLQQRKVIANIISHNVFQMNGLTKETPFSAHLPKSVQLDIFGEDTVDDVSSLVKTQIKDWKENKMISFDSLSSEESKMKFDVVIGNPPYQSEGIGDVARDEPIYHHFIDESYNIGSKVLLISPARFLFKAGQTPKSWNKKMLSDPHVKVLYFEQKSNNVFPGTDIKGGVAITYRDIEKDFGAIGTFTIFEELNSIVKKVQNRDDFLSFSDYVFPQGIYRFSTKFFEDFPIAIKLQGRGTKNKIVSKSLVELDFAFSEKNDTSSDNVALLGRIGKERVFRYLKKEYIDLPEVFFGYNVLVPEANGSGAIGEVLSTPLIGEPLIGHTDTFLSIGNFSSESEAQNCMKYIKSKFSRTMLGVLKITQHNSRKTWKNVPLQDFTIHSDIDWSQSVADIDRQLYKKYGLSADEIAFIETNIREMD